MRVIIGLLCIAFVLMMGGYYIQAQKEAQEARLAAEAKAKAEAEAKAAEEKKYEDVLNAFLDTMRERANAYRKHRDAFNQMLLPENLSDQRYVIENYQLMLTLQPQLQKEMEAIMASFREGDEKIKNLLAGSSSEMQKTVGMAWERLKKEQSATYMAFFTAEQDIMSADIDLMKFYVSRRGLFHYDVSQGRLVFNNNEDRVQEQRLITTAKDLEVQEGQMLGGDKTGHGPAPTVPQ